MDDLEASKREDVFRCSPLGEIELRGKFDREEINPHRKLEVEVRYLGFWAHTFLGISDGPVLTFHVGKAVVEQDGSFRLALPNISQAVDAPYRTNDDWFEVLVRDSETGNIVAELELPAAFSVYGHLTVAGSYPAELHFPRQQTQLSLGIFSVGKSPPRSAHREEVWPASAGGRYKFKIVRKSLRFGSLGRSKLRHCKAMRVGFIG